MLGDPDAVEAKILYKLKLPEILVERLDPTALIRYLADRKDTPFHRLALPGDAAVTMMPRIRSAHQASLP